MKIIDVKQDDFEKEVIENDKPVLVDFNASWCGPCRMVKPIVEEIAENNDQVKFVSIDVDEEEELAEKYDVSTIPCLVLFKDGKEVERCVGLISKKEIEGLIGK